MMGKDENLWDNFEGKDYETVDPANKRAFLEYQEFTKAVNRLEKEKLKAQLKKRKQQAKIKHLRVRRIYLSVVSSAAAILLLIFAYNHFTYKERLLSKYASTVDENNLMGKGTVPVEGTSLVMKRILEADKLRQAGEIDEAIEIFKSIEIIQNDRYHPYFVAQYELARTYIQIDRTDEARQVLIDITKRPESHYIKDYAITLIKDLDKTSFFYF